MGAVKAGTDKFRATETEKKIESTINQAIEDVTGSEMYYEIGRASCRERV